MPEVDPNTVTASYKRGLALARSGAFFEAHEAFEEAWRACEHEERDFFQGLVHVVVSAYQETRGRPVARERQRLKALRRLEAFTPAHRGLDVALLLAALGGLSETADVSAGRAERPDAASSVASIAMAIEAPCVLASERPSHPDDERRSAEPS